MLCDDGKVRNYRAHGLRKAALYTLYKAGGTVAELQALGGHGSIAELQKYIQEIEQDEQTLSSMAKVIAAQIRACNPRSRNQLLKIFAGRCGAGPDSRLSWRPLSFVPLELSLSPARDENNKKAPVRPGLLSW